MVGCLKTIKLLHPPWSWLSRWVWGKNWKPNRQEKGFLCETKIKWRKRKSKNQT